LSLEFSPVAGRFNRAGKRNCFLKIPQRTVKK